MCWSLTQTMSEVVTHSDYVWSLTQTMVTHSDYVIVVTHSD